MSSDGSEYASIREAIVAFGMKERFFHIEFFRDGDDYIMIGQRPAGFTIDVYNAAHWLYRRLVSRTEFSY